jgi:hypothetical protein
LTILIERERCLRSFRDHVLEIHQIQLLLLLFGSDGRPSVLMEVFAFLYQGSVPKQRKPLPPGNVTFYLL